MPWPRSIALALPPRLALHAALMVAVAGLAGPTVASATTTFSEFQGTITITGDDAPSQLIAIGTADQALFEERQPGAVLVAQAPCVLLTATTVDCGKADAGGKIVATLGGGDDTYAFPGNALQQIDGGDGNDRITTGTGKDALTGGPGNDELTAGAADDTLDGGTGDDRLDGGEGGDQLTGAAGRDTLLGDGGTSAINRNDKILARDGERDTIDCGGGYDLAEIDLLDAATNCSNLDRPGSGGVTVPSPDLGGPSSSSPGSGGGTATTIQGPLTFTIALAKRQTPRGLAAGKKLLANITPSATCTGTVRIALTKREAVRMRLGTTPLEIGASASTTFTAGTDTITKVGVTGEFRAKLRRFKRFNAALKVQCVDATGATTISAQPITIRR